MEIAILVFFLAIFGGILFLLGLIWFIVRRVRISGSPGRRFPVRASYRSDADEPDEIDSGADEEADYTNYPTFSSRERENQTASSHAGDSAVQTDNTYSYAGAGASAAAPVESGYAESGTATYDSSSSYDAGSSYDSSSGSSSDTGSSSPGDSGSSWSSD